MTLTRMVAIIFLFSGCATAQLASREMRRAEYKAEITKNPDEAFMAIRVALARGFYDASRAVKLDDAKSRTIVAHGNVSCTSLKMGNGFAKDERAEFVLTIRIPEKDLIVTFEEVTMMADTGWDVGLRPSNASEMNQISDECLKPVFQNLKMEALK